jgi:hypothetical protein
MKKRPFAYSSGWLAKTFALRLNMRGWLVGIILLSISISSYGQCKVDTNYCIGGGKVRLTAPSGTTYLWNTGATTQSVDVPGAGIYTVKVTGTACNPSTNTYTVNVGRDLVVNGNFTAGNTGFTTAYTYYLPNPPNPGNLQSQNYYAVTPNANPLFNLMHGFDHTVGNGIAPNNYLAMNGADAANKIFWAQTVTVTPNTDYYFSVFAIDLMTKVRSDTLLDRFHLNIVSVPSGSVSESKLFYIPYGIASDANPWNRYYFHWNSGAFSGQVQISMSEPFIGRIGNNFGIDDISMSRLNPVSLTSGTSNISVCPGSTINLTSPVTGGTPPYTYLWTGPASVPNPTTQNPSISGATAAMAGTYTVTLTDFFGCVVTGTVVVSVSSGIIITTTNPTTVCAGSPVNLTSSTTSTIPTTLLSENFNSIPAGWTTSTATSSGGTIANAAWTLRPSGYYYSWGGTGNNVTFNSNDNSQFFLSNSRAQGGTTTHTELISPVLNTVGYSILDLSFWQYFRSGTTNSVNVDVSINGGTTWINNIYTYNTNNTNLGAANNFVNSSVNLTAYTGYTNLKIRFRYDATNDYFWAIDNVKLTGTSTNYTISWISAPAGFISNLASPGNVTLLVNTTYTVTYTNPNAGGCSESKQVPVAVLTAPVITQPQNISSCAGPVTFSAPASSGTPTYQWYESTAGSGGPWSILTNVSPYSGVITKDLVINPITGKSGNYYHCLVSNGTCTTTSNPALLTVAGSGLVINSDPVTISRCAGDNASFTVVSNGQTYRWQVSIDNGSTFSNVPTGGIYSGESSATLNISNVTGLNLCQYRCVIEIPACSLLLNSKAAILNVLSYPVINIPPASTTICSNNANHSFTVSASGASSYQWQENSGAGWTDILNGGIYSTPQTPSLGLTTIPDNYNGYQYRCVVGNGACSTTSSSATLSITSAPVISLQPVSHSICSGDNTSFSLTAVSTGSLSYQWQMYDGISWSNAGANSSILNLTPGIGGTKYHCVVTDNCNQSAKSDTVTLSYNLPPVTAIQPRDTLTCADFGVYASFKVEPLMGVSYQWQVSSNGGLSWTNLVNDIWGKELGVHSSELEVFTPTPDAPPAVDAKDGFRYRCILTGTCSDTSNSALLTVRPTPFFTITGNTWFCNAPGSSTLLTANITGTYSYLWYKDGPSTDSTRQSITVLYPQTGNYTAKVTNTITGCSFTLAPAISVTTKPVSPAVSVSIAASANPICAGTFVTFTATPGPPYSINLIYQWKKNGAVVGGNNPTYTTSSLLNSDKIVCVLTALNVDCAPTNPATSNEITMVVNPVLPVSVTIAVDHANPICPGTTVVFTATPANGGTVPTYQWTKNGTPIVGASSSTYAIPSSVMADAGNYNVILTSDLLCKTGSPASALSSLTITTSQPTSHTVTSNPVGGAYCSGGTGVTIGLDATDDNTIYYLQRDGSDLIPSVSRPGSAGNPVNFGLQTIAGNYTVRAVSNANGCSRVFASSITVTINPLPSITLGANPIVCSGITAANLLYSATTGSPNQYSIVYSATALGAGFVNVTNAVLPASPIALTVPAAAATATYSATLTVRNSVTGCPSISYPITVTVSPMPSITLGVNPVVCTGVITANIAYTATTGSPDQYSIVYSAAALGAGFADVANAALTASPIVLSVPATAPVSAYTATLIVRNSVTGCFSGSYPISITINPLPSITLGANPIVCSGATTANLVYSAITGIPNQYSIVYSAAALGAGFVNVTNAVLPISPISLTVPAAAPVAVYTATLIVRNSATGCSSGSYPITVTINPLPTISLGTNPVVCPGITTANLSFSATTGSPDQYTIVYGAAALGAGFVNVTNASLPASPIILTVPVTAPAAVYTATLTVRNSVTGCPSGSYPLTVSVISLPTITLGANPVACPDVTSAALTYTATTGSPDQYSIVYNAIALGAGFVNVTNAALPASPIVLIVPATAPAAVYSATLTVRNSIAGCGSISYLFTITVNNIEVAGSIGPTTCYPTLQTAFAAINTGVHQGIITVKVFRSTIETGSAQLLQSGGTSNYSSVTIYPVYTGLSIRSNISTATSWLIDLNGADNVTIDGRVNQVGVADLTLIHTGTDNTSINIRFINSSERNIVRYCNIQGACISQGANSAGVIFFSNSTSGNGNDNNKIEYCNITNSGGTRPFNAISSSALAAPDNSGDTISNNNFYNFFNPTNSSNGIYIQTNSSAWTINGNSFYETTTTFTPSTIFAYFAIRITSGNNYTITGNYIGGRAPLCAGAAWTKNSGSYNAFYGIHLTVSNTPASNIQGNTIQNFAWSNSVATADWTGIFIAAGSVNIGTVIGNTIGAATGTGSITITNGSSTDANVVGIRYLSSSPATGNIQNNTIGSITTVSTSTFANNFYGIYKSGGTGALTISNNIIGSLTTANSINASSSSTVSTQNIYGISNTATGSVTISGNTIANMINANTYTTTPGATAGIHYSGLVGSTFIVSKNHINRLISTNKDVEIYGIRILGTGGSGTYSNNIINLGKTVTAGCNIYGISENSTSLAVANIYFNTVFLDGTVSSGGNITYSMYNAGNTTTKDFRNNIFYNTRSGGGGAHYAISLAGNTGLTINFNDYYAPNSLNLGRYAGIPIADLPTWRTTVGGDINSLNVNPNFTTPGGTALVDYIPSNMALIGNNLGINILDDIDQINIRCIPTMGAQENTSVPSAVTATAAPNPLCAGNALSLTGSALGATSWIWSGPNVYTSVLQNPTLLNISTAGAGVYTISAINCHGSATASTSTVVVNPSPTTSAIYHR